MNTQQHASSKVAALIDEFRTLALRHQSALASGRSDAANRAARQAFVCVDELSALGADAMLSLRILLADESPAVRSWAASQVWSVAPMEAVAVMQELARSGEGLVRFGAMEFLRQRGISLAGS